MLLENPKLFKLMCALEAKDTKKLTSLIESNPDFSNLIVPYGFRMGTPILCFLIQMQEPELVKLALNNMTKEEFNNILHIQSGTVKVRPETDSPLMQAVELGNIEIIRAIIEKDPTVLNKRQQSGTRIGWTPLTLAAYLGHDHLVELLVEYGVDVNFAHIAGLTAHSLAKSAGNQKMVDFLERHDAAPSMAQDNLLEQFATWLELKASSVEDEAISNVHYDKELIEKLAKDLRKNGHCSGFSWMHRIMMDKNQSDLFTTYMQKIGGWDKTAESLANDPFLDSCFNELLQVTIYAQQGESLDLSTKNSEPPSTSELLNVHQSSPEIARMISSNKSDVYFSNYVQLDEDQYVTTRSAAEIRAYIDKSYEINASTYTGSRNHAIDIGKTFKNGQEVYWIYNSNYDCGTMHFNSFDEFFLSLKFSLLTLRTIASFAADIAANSVPIELSSYMLPLEYRFEVSHENTKRPDQSIEDFIQQKMSTEFYSLIELDDEKIDGIYIEYKNNTFYFNKKEYKTLPELRKAITELCGENVNNKTLGAYDIKKIPPTLPDEVMIKMFIGAININDLDLAVRLKALISEGTNLDKLLESLAVNAAKNGNSKAIKAILTLKPELAYLEITSGSDKGESLITLAVQSKSTSCVDEILNCEPDLINYIVKEGTNKGHNILTIVVKQLLGSPEMITHLIKKHPELVKHNITEGMEIGFGPLNLAIKDGNEDKIKAILDCDPTVVNEVITATYRKDTSALMYAVTLGLERVVKALLPYNPNHDFVGKGGKRAIDLAKSDAMRNLLGARPASLLHQATVNTPSASIASSSGPSIRTKRKPST